MGRLYKRWARTALISGWVVLAGGCATPTPKASPAAPAQPAAQPAVQPPSQRESVSPDTRYIIVPSLEHALHVVSVSLINRPGAFLKIQVNVQNLTEAPQRFRYRIDWFNQDGARLPLAGPEYISWMLLPREASSIAATAPAPAAADFEIAFVPDVK